MNRFFFRKSLLAFLAGLLIALFASGAGTVFAKSKFSQEELAYMPAVQLIELFQKGETTSSEVLEAQISQVKKYNGEYNVSRRDLVNELDTFNAGKVNAITFDNFAEARKPYSSTNLMLTPIWNLASRYPVVAMPVELSDKNVPVGVQIVSNTYDDLNAFRVAYALSKTIAPLYKDGRFPDFRNAK